MSNNEIRVPDIGDFEKVPVIEVLIEPGRRIEQEQPLITLESDKATMEVPATAAGIVEALHVQVGDEVSEGDLIVTLAATETADTKPDSGQEAVGEEQRQEDETAADRADDRPDPRAVADSDSAGYDCDLLVLGSGPGGYAAAFRAADLGLDVILIERYSRLGGVCLNVGCIPSKALLHAGKVINEAAAMAAHGIRFNEPDIDPDKLRGWKDSVVERLTRGLDGLAKKRKVRVITGNGQFTGAHEIRIQSGTGNQQVSFRQCIIAAGSEAMRLPNLPWDDDRVMDSTRALELDGIPDQLMIIGGGIIGLEMACIYGPLGSEITVVELTDELMPGTDRDLIKPLAERLEQQGMKLHTGIKVTEVKAYKHALQAEYEGGDPPERKQFDRILCATGRVPNGHRIGAEKAGVAVDEHGFIQADRQQRTNIGHIFAIGDIIGHPMLAHKATHEGKVAAEVAAGENVSFDARVIPSVAYTDPEIAWAGVTETGAREKSLEVEITRFPWAASGRSLGMGRSEGLTKLIFDRHSKRLIGAGIAGPNAGDLISECALAIEMGCDAEDIGLTIHPHPSLSETVAMAAEAMTGTLTDLYLPKKKSA